MIMFFIIQLWNMDQKKIQPISFKLEQFVYMLVQDL